MKKRNAKCGGMDAGAAVSGGFLAGHTHHSAAMPATQPLPERLQAVSGALLAAFDEPTRLAMSLTSAASPAGEPFREVFVHLDGGGGWGFGIDMSEPVDELLVSLAEGSQEHLPEQSVSWGHPRHVMATSML
jgi:hypothetical protein